MAATTLSGFGPLPCELRHMVWEYYLPTQTSALIEKLASIILKMKPQDTGFWRGCAGAQWRPKSYNPHRLEERPLFQQATPQETTPPYQELAGCVESRVLALKHIKKELEKHKDLSRWIRNPPFPFRPKLILDNKNAALIYVCPEITDGFHLEKTVFGPSSTPVATPETDEESMWSDLDD